MFAIIAPLALSALLACSSNKDSSSQSSSHGSSIQSSIIEEMTESYRIARQEFKQVTGIDLPAYGYLEVAEHEYHEGDTQYELNITGGNHLTYDKYLEFEALFTNLIGNPTTINPTGSEDMNRFAEWENTENRWFRTDWIASSKTIKITTHLIVVPPEMTSTYKKAREQFYELTKVELPTIYEVEADQENIDSYVSGQDEYTVELISGDNLKHDTFVSLESFFKYKMGDGTSSIPGEYGKWIFGERFYELTYTESQTIKIFTKIYQPQMTESYKAARNAFHSLTSILLPDVFDVEIMPSSIIDLDNKTVTIDVPANETLYESFFNTLDTVMADYRTKELPYSYSWLYEFDLNNQKYQASVDLDYIESAYVSIHAETKGYYTIELTGSEFGTENITYQDEDHAMRVTDVLEGEKLVLSATPNDGYTFSGWYKDDQLLSSDNPYEYTVKENAVIEARYLEIADNMTESYRKARLDFYTLTNIYLPRYEGLIIDYQEPAEGFETYQIDIVGGENLSEQTFLDFKAFFDSALADWNTEAANDVSASYSSKYGESVDLVWDDGTLSIYANFPKEFNAGSYELGRDFINEFYGILLPEYEDVDLDKARFARDGSNIKFIFYKDTFTKNDYFAIKDIITEATDEPVSVDEEDENYFESSWDYSYTTYTLSWNANSKTISLLITANV